MCAFQRDHGLKADGAIGPATRGALRAVLTDGDARLAPAAAPFDPTDEHAVSAFQREWNITQDGIVGPETSGAMAVARLRPEVDIHDPASIGAFQQKHELTADGRLGPETKRAIRAIMLERLRSGGDARRQRGEPGFSDSDSPQPTFDAGSSESIRAFQRTVGLTEDGVAGEQTRAALRALHLLGITTAPSLVTDTGLLPDPLERSSVRRFQKQHGLTDDGRIGPATQRAIRAERRRSAGVDPADATSVRRFQHVLGLTEDGVIGEATRGALTAARDLIPGADNDEPDREEDRDPADREESAWSLDPLLGVDPTDPGSICSFQHSHGLVADGIIGPHTQTALRALRAEQQGAMGVR